MRTEEECKTGKWRNVGSALIRRVSDNSMMFMSPGAEYAWPDGTIPTGYMPFGGIGDEGETCLDATIRELKEEIGLPDVIADYLDAAVNGAEEDVLNLLMNEVEEFFADEYQERFNNQPDEDGITRLKQQRSKKIEFHKRLLKQLAKDKTQYDAIRTVLELNKQAHRIIDDLSEKQLITPVMREEKEITAPDQLGRGFFNTNKIFFNVPLTDEQYDLFMNSVSAQIELGFVYEASECASLNVWQMIYDTRPNPSPFRSMGTLEAVYRLVKDMRNYDPSEAPRIA